MFDTEQPQNEDENQEIESGFDEDLNEETPEEIPEEEQEEQQEEEKQEEQEEEQEDLSLAKLQEDKDKAEKKARTAIEQKKKWRNKAKLNEALVEKEIVNFRFDHPNLKTSQVEEIHEFAKANGITLEEAYNKPLVKQYLSNIEKSQQVINAVPKNSKSNSVNKKQIDWASASMDDVRKHRQEILQRKSL